MSDNKIKFSRFERVDSQKAIETSFLIGRYDLQQESEINNEGYIGEFLSKMWTIYGAAEIIY